MLGSTIESQPMYHLTAERQALLDMAAEEGFDDVESLPQKETALESSGETLQSSSGGEALSVIKEQYGEGDWQQKWTSANSGEKYRYNPDINAMESVDDSGQAGKNISAEIQNSKYAGQHNEILDAWKSGSSEIQLVSYTESEGGKEITHVTAISLGPNNEVQSETWTLVNEPEESSEFALDWGKEEDSSVFAEDGDSGLLTTDQGKNEGLFAATGIENIFAAGENSNENVTDEDAGEAEKVEKADDWDDGEISVDKYEVSGGLNPPLDNQASIEISREMAKEEADNSVAEMLFVNEKEMPTAETREDTSVSEGIILAESDSETLSEQLDGTVDAGIETAIELKTPADIELGETEHDQTELVSEVENNPTGLTEKVEIAKSVDNNLEEIEDVDLSASVTEDEVVLEVDDESIVETSGIDLVESPPEEIVVTVDSSSQVETSDDVVEIDGEQELEMTDQVELVEESQADVTKKIKVERDVTEEGATELGEESRAELEVESEVKVGTESEAETTEMSELAEKADRTENGEYDKSTREVEIVSDEPADAGIELSEQEVVESSVGVQAEITPLDLASSSETVVDAEDAEIVEQVGENQKSNDVIELRPLEKKSDDGISLRSQSETVAMDQNESSITEKQPSVTALEIESPEQINNLSATSIPAGQANKGVPEIDLALLNNSGISLRQAA